MANWCRVEFPEDRRVKVNRRWNGKTNALKFLGEDGTYKFSVEGDDSRPQEIEERDVSGYTKWSPLVVTFRQV